MRSEEPIILIAPMSERLRYLLSSCRGYKERLERLSDATNIALASHYLDEVFSDVIYRHADTPEEFRTMCVVYSQMIVAIEMLIRDDIDRIAAITDDREIAYVRDMEIQDSWWTVVVGFRPYTADV